MTVPVLAAAKRLAERSGWSLSNLELQKILYIAHMFYMGEHDGEPLVPGHFEAWDYGPVHPRLYHHAKIFGSSPVENIFRSVPDLGQTPEALHLDEAAKQLSHLSSGRLVAATHRPNGAWEQNYIPGARNIIIPNEAILAEYRALQDGDPKQQ